MTRWTINCTQSDRQGKTVYFDIGCLYFIGIKRRTFMMRYRILDKDCSASMGITTWMVCGIKLVVWQVEVGLKCDSEISATSIFCVCKKILSSSLCCTRPFEFQSKILSELVILNKFRNDCTQHVHHHALNELIKHRFKFS